MSIIFTTVGMWSITCSSMWKISGLEKDEYIYKQLDNINNKLYFKSHKGRIEPGLVILNEYMKDLRQMLSKIGWDITLNSF